MTDGLMARPSERDDAKSEDSNRMLPVPNPLLVELKAAKKRQLSDTSNRTSRGTGQLLRSQVFNAVDY